MKVPAVLALLSLLVALSGAAVVRPRPTSDDQEQPIRSLEEVFQSALNKIELEYTGNANDYVDQVMELARKEILDQGLDNVPLPDDNFGFNFNLWPFGKHFGGVKIYQGFLKGMETINRVGDASLTTAGTTVSFDCVVGVNDASLGYKISILFLDIGPSGSLSGDIAYAHVAFKATVDIFKKTVTLDKFDIKQIGHIDTDIKGLGIFNWLAEAIANLAINLTKGVIKELIEGPIKGIIQQILDDLIPHTAAQFYYVLH